MLVEKEVIFAEDVEHIFGKRPWTSRSEEIIASENKNKIEEQAIELEENSDVDSNENAPEVDTQENSETVQA